MKYVNRNSSLDFDYINKNWTVILTLVTFTIQVITYFGLFFYLILYDVHFLAFVKVSDLVSISLYTLTFSATFIIAVTILCRSFFRDAISFTDKDRSKFTNHLWLLTRSILWVFSESMPYWHSGLEPHSANLLPYFALKWTCFISLNIATIAAINACMAGFTLRRFLRGTFALLLATATAGLTLSVIIKNQKAQHSINTNSALLHNVKIILILPDHVIFEHEGVVTAVPSSEIKSIQHVKPTTVAVESPS